MPVLFVAKRRGGKKLCGSCERTSVFTSCDFSLALNFGKRNLSSFVGRFDDKISAAADKKVKEN